MKTKNVLAMLVAAGLVVLVAPSTMGGEITGGALLSEADANQLETWLGVGDQDFTNIWSGDAGVATAISFHSAVDGAGPTFSIFGISLNDASNTTVRIGGYTTLSWGGSTGYQVDSSAFIFNLDTLEAQFTQTYPQFATYRNPNYFSTFGGGHDLFAGAGTLGTFYGSTGASDDGYSFSHSYDQSQGQITVAGDSGYNAGDSGIPNDAWSVNSLEVYTIAAVPEPATALSLMLGGLVVVGYRRIRKNYGL